MDTTTLIGVIGAALILIAFSLNQTNIWKNSSFQYDLTNLVGGGVLMYYAFLLDSWPFLILNAVWTLVSLKDVLASLFARA